MTAKAWAILLVCGAVLVWGYSCNRHLDAEITRLQHEKARVDTVYKTLTKTLTKVRVRTDSLLRTDTLFRADTVRKLIGIERAACDSVILACERRVAVRDTLIHKLLRKVSPPLLLVSASGIYSLSDNLFAVRAGASVGGVKLPLLGDNVRVFGYETFPLQKGAKPSLTVGLRKEWRIF